MLVMYDDVTASLIPASAQAVAGYVDGNFANYNAIVTGWPSAKHLSIAVHAASDADCLDCEPGDAGTNDFGPWAKRQIARKGPFWKPVGYASVSNINAVMASALAAGLTREQVRLWSAHTQAGVHICHPGCFAGLEYTCDGTQWDWTALGRSLDESLLLPDFFAPVPPPKPPKPKDPHHYLWFGMERSNVEEYDLYRRHPIKNRKVLKLKRAQLLNGAKRVAANVIHEAPKKGTAARKAAWTKDRRGWRYSQLIQRANGKRVVK